MRPHTHIPALNVEHSFLLSSWKEPKREPKEMLMSETSVTISTRDPPRRSMSRERNFRGMRAARAQTDNRRKAAPPTGYTRAKSLQNDGCESPSSQLLVIGRVINHQTALRVSIRTAIWTIIGIMDVMVVGGPARYSRDPFVTPRV